jgi:hypothetical protein
MAEPSDPWSSASVYVRSAACAPEVLTETLGLVPAFTHRRGEPLSRRRPDGPRREWNGWSLSSPLPDSAPLQLHVAALLDLLHERRDRVLSLPPDCEIELLLGLTAAPLGRLHDIDAESIRRMADLSISLRIDLYEADLTDHHADE